MRIVLRLVRSRDNAPCNGGQVFMNQAPRQRWMSQKEEAVKKSIYFTKTHGLLVESLEQAIMNIRVVAQNTHPEV